MREIDFLPEWYRASRRRQIGYRTQYIVIGGLVLIMIVWNYFTCQSVLNAKNTSLMLKSASQSAQNVVNEISKTEQDAKQLEKKLAIQNDLESRVDVASVLGEIAYLLNKDIVLSKVIIKAESFSPSKQAPAASIRIAGMDSADKGLISNANIRYKLTMNGIANDASDIAEIVSKFEDSPYFCNVLPVFSHNKDIKSSAQASDRFPNAKKVTTNSGTQYLVNEFQIDGFVENYRLDKNMVAKANQK
jgi:hypothetical protein